MTTNFKIDLIEGSFEFITMNRVTLQLFQVYVMHENKRCRFHMQLNDSGVFYITNKQVCPEIFYGLESTLSDAILKLGKV